jgi:hypothetical protein
MTELSLQQRLESRSSHSPGAIDTHHLHLHDPPTQATVDRLVQRLALPESIATRYRVGVSQASIQRFTGQRRETFPGMVGMATSWRIARSPDTETSEIQRFSVAVRPLESLNSTQELAQEQPDRPLTSENSPPTPVQPAIPQRSLENSISQPGESPKLFRLSRQPQAAAESSPHLDPPHETIAASHPNQETTEEKAIDRYPELNEGAIGTTFISRKNSVSEVSESPGRFRLSRKPQALARPSLNVDPSHETIATKVTPEEATIDRYPELNEGAIVSRKTPDRISRRPIAPDLSVERMENSPSVERQEILLPLQNREITASEPTPIQRQPLKNAIATKPNPGEPLPLRETTPLPLSNSRPSIQRQANPSAAIETTATPASPPTANSNIDIAQIAEQVSRMIYRQLEIEQERRGRGR